MSHNRKKSKEKRVKNSTLCTKTREEKEVLQVLKQIPLQHMETPHWSKNFPTIHKDHNTISSLQSMKKLTMEKMDILYMFSRSWRAHTGTGSQV